MSQLSRAQHGIWISTRTGAATAYHMPLLIVLAEQPDHGALAKACASLVERHPLLGSAVREHDGVPRFEPAAVPPVLETGGSVDELVARPFDLEQGPLIRFALVDQRTLVVVAHHLVFDGHSKDLLVSDLAAYYRGELPGDLRPAAPAPVGAADAAERAAEDAAEGAASFWAARWREPGALALPGGELRSRAAAGGGVVEFPLEIPLIGLTGFEVLVAAVHALLGSYGNPDVATALDLSTRTAAESGRIGCHVNELPLFSKPSAETPFTVFATELRGELRETYRYRSVPLSRAVPGIRPHAALAPVSISYRRTAQASWPGGEVEWLAFNHSVRGALQLQVVQGEPDAAGVASAVASLRYDPREVTDPARFVADLTALLAAIVGDPSRTLGELREFDQAPQPSEDPGQQPRHPADGPPEPPAASADDPLIAPIRAIWEQVLDLAPIDPHDDIFDLGGHSLTITQIISRMQRQLGVEISLDDFFENSTIAGVVAVVRG